MEGNRHDKKEHSGRPAGSALTGLRGLHRLLRGRGAAGESHMKVGNPLIGLVEHQRSEDESHQHGDHTGQLDPR